MHVNARYPRRHCFSLQCRTLLIIIASLPLLIAIPLFIPPHDDYADQAAQFVQVSYCTALTFIMLSGMKFYPLERAFGLTLLSTIHRKSILLFALLLFLYLLALFITRPYFGEITRFFLALVNFSDSIPNVLHRISLIVIFLISFAMIFRRTPKRRTRSLPHYVWFPLTLLHYPCYILFMIAPIHQAILNIQTASKKQNENHLSPYFSLASHCLLVLYFIIALFSRLVTVFVNFFHSWDWTVSSSNDVSPSLFQVDLVRQSGIPSQYYRDVSPSFVALRMKHRNGPCFRPPSYFFVVPGFDTSQKSTENDKLTLLIQNGRGSFTSAIEYNTQPGSRLFLSGPYRIAGPCLEGKKSTKKQRKSIAPSLSSDITDVETEQQLLHPPQSFDPAYTEPESLVVCNGESLGYLASLIVRMHSLLKLGELRARLRVVIHLSNGRELSSLEMLREMIVDLFDVFEIELTNSDMHLKTDGAPVLQCLRASSVLDWGFSGDQDDPTQTVISQVSNGVTSDESSHISPLRTPQHDLQSIQGDVNGNENKSYSVMSSNQQKHYSALQSHPLSPLRLFILFSEDGSTREVKQNKALRKLVPPGSHRQLFDAKLDPMIVGKLLDDPTNTECFLIGENAYEWRDVCLDSRIKHRCIHTENLLI
ncbi:hypothetical protein BLNAU_12491 [Blattamonas nauphoetae]|uniref:Uncharacterized protein n=1 Tax=Blattamonas nauphoetae TaxID=2049346 RepID=A0ABQ9XQI7_9EUKA|nr:hypothetical protein BLNAU_12491 [Blattamonas nauphoetae]